MTESTRETLDVDAIQARRDKLDGIPWAGYRQGYGATLRFGVENYLGDDIAVGMTPDHAEFAGYAPEDIDALVTEVRRLTMERDTLRACVTAITAAWWSATEPTDTGYTYTDDTDKAMDTIWAALASVASAQAPADNQDPTRRAPHEQPAALAGDGSGRLVERVAEAVFERTGAVSWVEAQRDARVQFLADAEVAVSTVLGALGVKEDA